MWFKAIDDIATRAHWRMVILSKGSCPAALLPTHPPGVSGRWAACDQWHQFAIDRINKTKPDLLVISQEYNQAPDGVGYSTSQWRHGLEELFRAITAPKTEELVIGNIPATLGPNCLLQHLDDVPACSAKPLSALTPFNRAEQAASTSAGVAYIDVTPWFCATTCSTVIGHFDVYFNSSHVAVGYTRFLEGVLAQALNLSGLKPGPLQ
jgi:hypothetical protein